MSRPGFYFCFCPDPNLLKMQIETILHSSGQKEWTKQTIWLDDNAQEDKLWKALNLPDMLGSTRAVILRKCECMVEKFWKDISPILSGFRPGIWPFFCLESEWKYGKAQIPKYLENTKFLKFARKKGWVWESQGLTRKDVGRYIIRKCDQLGIKPGPGVEKHLSNALPLDSHSIDMELEKMALLAYPEKTVLKEHLEAVSSDLEIDIFAFMQEVQKGRNITAAWGKIFKDNLSGKEMLFPFLGLLVREARIMWLLSTGQGRQVSLTPWIRKQKEALASSMGPDKISVLWELALEAEAGVKSGDLHPEHAMDKLTARLFRLFSR